MNRGILLIEMMVYLAGFTILSSVLALTLYSANQSFTRARNALDDMDRAERCLRDLKRDLRNAETIRLPDGPSGTLTVTRSDGTTHTYEIDATLHTVTRTTSIGTGAYGGSIESVEFEDAGDRLIVIHLTLRRRSSNRMFSPTWSTAVHCRNRKP